MAHIAGDDIYDNVEARSFAEAGLLDEALDRWNRPIAAAWGKEGAGAPAQGPKGHRASGPQTDRRRPRPKVPSCGRTRHWWDRPTVRELDVERDLAILPLFAKSTASPDAHAARRRRSKGAKRPVS